MLGLPEGLLSSEPGRSCPPISQRHIRREPELRLPWFHLSLPPWLCLRFPDIDALEVGNPGLTFKEHQTQFTLWAIMKVRSWGMGPAALGTLLSNLLHLCTRVLSSTREARKPQRNPGPALMPPASRHSAPACVLVFVPPPQAPLMLGNDVRNMSSQTLSIISNKEVIAVNQGALLVHPSLLTPLGDVWLPGTCSPCGPSVHDKCQGRGMPHIAASPLALTLVRGRPSVGHPVQVVVASFQVRSAPPAGGLMLPGCPHCLGESCMWWQGHRAIIASVQRVEWNDLLPSS